MCAGTARDEYLVRSLLVLHRSPERSGDTGLRPMGGGPEKKNHYFLLYNEGDVVFMHAPPTSGN